MGQSEAPTPRRLTGDGAAPPGARRVSAGVDSAGQLLIFAVDDAAGQNLWILRQSGVDPHGYATFADWVQLGSTLTDIACPTVMNDGPEVFAVDAGRVLSHVRQTLADGTWFTRPIEAPAPSSADPVVKSTFTTEVTCVDDNGSPVPNVVMNVTSDRPAVLVVGGVSYPVDVSPPASIPVDAAGKATITIVATKLTAPQLTFTVGDPESGGFSCSHAADFQTHQRLAGNDAGFPVTGPALVAAGLADAGQADAAARAIEQAGLTAVSLASGDVSSLQAWSIDFTSTRPTFRFLTDAERDAALRPTALRSVLGKIWGDVAHYLKHAAKDLAKVSVAVVDGVINFSVQILGDTHVFPISTLRQAGDLLETIVAKVAAAGVDVADAVINALGWLQYAFDWGAILRTHQVLRYCMNGMLTYLDQSVETGEAWVEQIFSELRGKVDAAFASAESIFSKGLTFNQLANQLGPTKAGPVGPSGNVLDAAPLTAAHGPHATRCNYLHAKAKTFFASGGAASLLSQFPAPSSGDPFSNLVTVVEPQIQSLESAFQQLQQYLQTKVQTPAQLLDCVALDLLTACQIAVDAVIDVCEDILLAILDGVEAAIQAFQGLLVKPLEVPVVSWLYRHVITDGDTLTLLDLLSLCLAAPVTILYEVLFGGAPFSADQVSTIVDGAFPLPAIPAPGAARALPRAPRSSDAEEALGTIGGVLTLVGVYFDTSLDLLAWADIDDEIPRVATLVSGLSIGVGLVGSVLSFPCKPFAAGDPKTADWWALGLWATNSLPVCVDLICTIFSKSKAAARLSGLAGQLVCTLEGALSFGIGVGVDIAQKEAGSLNPWDVVSNTLAPIPMLCKPLASIEDPRSIAVLEGIDLVCGLADSIAGIGGAWAGEARAPANAA